MAAPKGHKKWGGKKKGTQNKKTIDRKIVEEAFRQRILLNIQGLLTAQIKIAKGTSYLFKIVKTKKGGKEHILVDDPLEIKYVLDEVEGEGELDNNYYYISIKQPDNRALDSLMNRVFGTVKESLDITSLGKELPTPILRLNKNAISRSKRNKKNISPDQED